MLALPSRTRESAESNFRCHEEATSNTKKIPTEPQNRAAFLKRIVVFPLGLFLCLRLSWALAFTPLPFPPSTLILNPRLSPTVLQHFNHLAEIHFKVSPCLLFASSLNLFHYCHCLFSWKSATMASRLLFFENHHEI